MEVDGAMPEMMMIDTSSKKSTLKTSKIEEKLDALKIKELLSESVSKISKFKQIASNKKQVLFGTS
jgi:hypothetical protein